MIGLYFHIPFCLSKCPYCDFFSLSKSCEQISEYTQMLLKEMELYRLNQPHSEVVDTVFFGGGTPSLLKPEEVEALLLRVDTLWGLAEDAEITLEANPGTLDWQKLMGYKAAGINRLSLGVQSFDPEDLQILGRQHSRFDAEDGLSRARQAGFKNIGIDLIFGLPGQTREGFRQNLERALEFAPEHLSLYGLTVEEGTSFARLQDEGQLSLPAEEVCAGIYEEAHYLLETSGYSHYEISNFSRPGFQCRHNLIYWRRQPCMGFGAGSHGFLARSWGERWATPADLEHYGRCLEKGFSPARRLETFSRKEAMGEFLYLGLRTAEGVQGRKFAQIFGETVSQAFPNAMERTSGHLVFKDGYYRMTFEGWLLYNFFIQEFL